MSLKNKLRSTVDSDSEIELPFSWSNEFSFLVLEYVDDNKNNDVDGD